MSSTTELADRIRRQITQAEAEVQRLRRALAALADPEPAAVSRPRRAARVKRSGPAVVKGVSVAKIVKLVSDSGGMTTSTLAQSTGGDQAQILQLLKAAEVDGQVRRSGQRRATRWHLVTDEDRVAERAAELEAARAPVVDAAAAAQRKEARRKAAERRARLAKRAVATAELKRAS